MSESVWQAYNPSKQALRQHIWAELQTNQAVDHDPRGHIPNFLGSEKAASQLTSLEVWQTAQVIKCNPDKAQLPVRAAALQAGKMLYMAVPRLIDEHCFVALRQEWLPDAQLDFAVAAEKKNVLKFGRPVTFAQMEPIDLLVVGCVAAAKSGGRTGKGAGFADLELAMLQMFRRIKPTTKIATTIHPLQLIPALMLPLENHDWPLDWICTPEQAIATHHTHPQPQGLDWDKIKPHQWDSIPVLKRLQAAENLH
ncbi:MAG: 5-formyltetrahydrofolate cyclo-ligase [Limnothrix sp.]